METAIEEKDPIVIQIEEKATAELAKINITEGIIKKVNKDYMGLTIKSVTDVEGINAAKEAHQVVKKLISETKKYCKTAREDAYKVQKAWIAKEKEIVEQLQPVSDHLDAERKRIDAEVERIKIREERMKQLPDRKARLDRLDVKMSDDEILDYDDLAWGNLINQKMDEQLNAKEAEMKAKEEAIAKRERELAEKEAELNKPKTPEKSDVVVGPNENGGLKSKIPLLLDTFENALKRIGKNVNTGKENYYYIPYWVGINNDMLYPLDSIPPDLSDAIKAEREGK